MTAVQSEGDVGVKEKKNKKRQGALEIRGKRATFRWGWGNLHQFCILFSVPSDKMKEMGKWGKGATLKIEAVHHKSGREEILTCNRE